MIRFCRHSEIDPQKWDNAIAQAQFPTVFASYDLLTILAAESKWNALIMDDYEYVMPLPERSKLGLHYIYTPFFLPQLGIFSSHEVTASVTSDFFNAFPEEFLQIDILLNTHNDTSFIDQYTISLVSHQLDLQQPHSTLFDNYSKNTQRNIKSAEKYDLTSTQDCDIEEIIHLFIENRGKRKEVHFRRRDYKHLLTAARFLLSKELLDVRGIQTNDGQLIAGALFVKDYQRRWFWFSGRDTKYAQCKPMFYLLDQYIQENAEQPLILDFNGSMNENVARLYKSFGGIPYDIEMINFTRASHFDRLIKLYHRLKK